MKDMTINLVNDLRNIVIKDMRQMGHFVDDSSTPFQVFRLWINILSRRIPKRNWIVEVSKELSDKLKTMEYANKIFDIKAEAVEGKDLNSRLSRSNGKSQFNDLLLNDWGVSHLHLGSIIEIDGFSERSSEILFIVAKDPTLYFIDVKPHGSSFSSKSLMEIVYSNWPQLLNQYHIGGLIAPDNELSTQEIHSARKAGLMALLTLDGKVFMPPGGGLTTIGTNPQHTMQADKLIRSLQTLEKEMLNSTLTIRHHIRQTGKRCPKTLKIKLTALADRKVYLIETSTRSIFTKEILW